MTGADVSVGLVGVLVEVLTEIEAYLVCPAPVALICTVDDVVADLNCTENLALVAPAGTVRDVGMVSVTPLAE